MTPTQTTIVEILIPLATLIYIAALVALFLLRNNVQLTQEIEREQREFLGHARQMAVERQRAISNDVQRSAQRSTPSRTLNSAPIPRQTERKSADEPRYEEPPRHSLPA